MDTPYIATPLHHRVREGLARVATVLRVDDWSRSKAASVNPTQYAILEHLEGRLAGAGIKDISSQLGVSQPTVTDSVAALERKGLVDRRSAPEDRRAVLLRLTVAGHSALRAGDVIQGVAERAVSALPSDRQEELLVTLISMIRQLQEAGDIPIQRMCVSCRHFRPNARADADRPHHCAFVDAAFGAQDLRVDCREHETADPAFRAATWNAFERVRPSLQAT